MNILYITNNAKMYGANLCLCELLIDLRERYNVNSIVLVKEEGPLVDYLRQKSIKCICIPFANALKMEGAGFIKNFYWYIRDVILPIPKIISEIKKEKTIDIIHTGTSVIDIGFYISLIMKKPHIWHVRETREQYNFEYLLPRYLVKSMFKKSKCIISISNYVKKSIIDLIGNREQIRIIYDGIKFDCYKGKVEGKENQLPVKFCVVGLLYKNKMQYKVLQACNVLEKREIRNFELYLIGDGESKEKQRLYQYVEENQLSGKVHFMGYRNDVNELLRTMDVGIMPSKFEGFGRVTIEYMTHYMPVIASDSGANVELIRNMENGLIYSVEDEMDLATCMEHFILNRDEIKRMGENAQCYASNNFSIITNSDKVYQEYQKALE